MFCFALLYKYRHRTKKFEYLLRDGSGFATFRTASKRVKSRSLHACKFARAILHTCNLFSPIFLFSTSNLFYNDLYYFRKSRRERKTDRQVCSEEMIKETRRQIENGESKRSVASFLGRAESTSRFRLNRPQCVTKLGRFDTTFSLEVEKDFCNHLHTLDEMFYGLTAKKRAAYEYAEKHNIPHRFNKEIKIAGKECLFEATPGYFSKATNLNKHCTSNRIQ